MAAPTIVNTATASGQPSSGYVSVVCNVPTGVQEGDLLVAFLVGSTDAWMGPCDGWAPAVLPYSDDYVAGNAVYRVAGASEPASYTFTRYNSSYAASVIMVAVRGAHTRAVPVAAISATAWTAPAISTPVNDCLVLRFIGCGVQSRTYTMPAGTTEDCEVSSGTGTFVASGVLGHATQASAGSTGTCVVTPSPTGNNYTVAVTLALQPADTYDTTTDATISLVNYKTALPAQGTTTAAIEVPAAVQANDLLVLVVTQYRNINRLSWTHNVWLDPGWYQAQLDEFETANAGGQMIAWRYATGSEPASYNVYCVTSVAAPSLLALSMLALRGVKQSWPLDAASALSHSASESPAITTLANNAYILRTLGDVYSPPAAVNWAAAGEILDITQTNGSNKVLQSLHGSTLGTAGNAGTVSYAPGLGVSYIIGRAVSFAPAGGSASTGRKYGPFVQLM